MHGLAPAYLSETGAYTDFCLRGGNLMTNTANLATKMLATFFLFLVVTLLNATH